MNTGFFLAEPSKDVSSINMIVRHNGERYKRAIGVSVKTSMWSQKSQRAKVTQDYRDGAKVNFMVQKYRSAVQRLIDNEKCPDIVDAKHFWVLVDCEINGKDYENVSSTLTHFTDYYENVFIRRFRITKSESRIKRLKTTLSILKKIEEGKGKRFTFSEINAIFYRDLEAYFAERKYSPNYFGLIVKIIKQVMLEATDVDKINTNTDFKSTVFKATSNDADSVYLTENELNKIYNVKIDEEFVNRYHESSDYSGRQSRIESYKFTKEIFLIGAYTGLRLSDFKRIKPENIGADRITMIAEKTKQKTVIPIHPIVRAILAAGFDFERQLSEQKIRLYIKDICKDAGITQIIEVRRSTMRGVEVEQTPKWKLVGTHTARRSFATNAYLCGVPTLAIMKITGHTKESTFMKYIRISETENADILLTHPFFKA